MSPQKNRSSVDIRLHADPEVPVELPKSINPTKANGKLNGFCVGCVTNHSIHSLSLQPDLGYHSILASFIQ
ncbi:hypothetical protein PROFUN_12105 [Planoprotostelium fungivorum]|uniref:Uncharacterized protein n=1 Tax=Planoprotostelium fungivorum TaxID=1890364 RepID=A0A2P6N8E4_9EUKA|nr:hypothetical protein PROFUN_12105 [Planoprotostelium fungivorum]